MARKFFSAILIVLSAIFFILSAAGIGAVWFYKAPLTRLATGQLKDIDTQLAQAETTLQSSEKELQRALRIVDATQAAMDKLTKQTQGEGTFLERIQSTLDDRLIPELKTTRTRLESASNTLESLQKILANISSLIPGVDLRLLDNILKDLITSSQSLDVEIKNIQELATQASTFVGDTSFLLGGDLSETRNSLENFLTAIQEYEKKVAGWRQQDQQLLAGAPGWIDQASIILTIFLVWFGLSQFGLLLHGLNIWRGFDPWMRLSSKSQENPLFKNAKDMELEE